MSQPRILIAGAGLGGLCLAQGLKKAGIDFHVYERDKASNYRLQGYRIRIHSDGIDALHQCLPTELSQLFEDTCAEFRVGPGPMADPLTGELQERQPGQGPPAFANARTVDRRVLRDVLLIGIEDHVSFGKEVDHFSTNGSDSATVFFKDGTSESGSLLVGADGLHSQVRRHYLPNHTPLDTGGRIIFGKTPLTSELIDVFPSGLLRAMSMIRDPKASTPTFTVIEPVVFPPPTSRPAYPELPKDYVYWVICTQESDLSHLLSPDQLRGRISTEAAVSASKQVTAHWHPSLRTLFELQDPSQTSVIPISTHLPSMSEWESLPTVTLLGDAAHVMPPTAASGCVTALRDAAALVNMITARGIKDGVAAYELEMREYAGTVITASLDAAVRGFGFKPREEWKSSED